MKNFNAPIKTIIACGLMVCAVSSCKLLGIGGNKGGTSSTTGAAYATENDLLGYKPYDDQALPNPPGMVFVQGGRTVLGSFEQDLYGSRDNIERTVTVNSFFMDETEVTNKNWKEYVHYQFYPMDIPLPRNVEIEDPANNNAQGGGTQIPPYIPDWTRGHNGQSKEEIEPNDAVWSSDFSFNDVYAENYYSNPGFNDYPVVGVTWRQVSDFCKWRTDFVNMRIIFDMEIEMLPDAFVEEFFVKQDDDSYFFGVGGTPLTGTGGGAAGAGSQMVSMDEFDRWQQEVIQYINEPANRGTFIERGIYLPDFRLPNEAEWEYAAKATIGTVYLDENEEYGRIYPWDGRGTRNPYGKNRGDQLANFKRGRGDYAGIAGGVNNDGSVTPEKVGGREPNDFNLFNMAGNVSEWVFDTYRPLAFQEFEDMNPVRKPLGDNDVSDPQSNYGWEEADPEKKGQITKTTPDATYRSLVNDRSKVYKGGSWKDVAYWMAPGTRRYLDMDKATNTIGFRCAMISIGTQQLDQSNGFLGIGGEE
ncbi:gliding motility-associated lipoprotein GldJ/gliding motility-associated lipoprotein GldJ,TIGR03530 [Roseivirga pacifica]|uniref:Gliding motility-associated lipoprotein GldJ/gliding motility-associated lipoprotein GldJ,TIGR03530 n=1 Tax=Roseivirga pacifica TaxID=1267423 RepID=A0A1I0MV20_9BACT|nr:SUMF1/EgtB/PvdO family nonheme iron enzyme [Roseivirga pacifica]MCO6359259.1 SUMF1/EgtB/PvdO family nonheme iron enzyme [Roseivirga pacifica]MCO6365105.1 SUMF1/EgtB/PvdO family nonheme iron enzyme [Roseivirga pacifica]MCO6372165.1 SUMF1/EgtB/PvdO family nonheme iron enzyme [Roseivirga pacifica]MCO6375724.1 SUMF1/EgtB/PvdO family nonheme iron enzyme [Roseivirga pacifica]MCO6379543.1 SUMF1/EgtB/PvdO family nonheme iron enzyme [Roseivirga pacifica]